MSNQPARESRDLAVMAQMVWAAALLRVQPAVVLTRAL